MVDAAVVPPVRADADMSRPQRARQRAGVPPDREARPSSLVVVVGSVPSRRRQVGRAMEAASYRIHGPGGRMGAGVVLTTWKSGR